MRVKFKLPWKDYQRKLKALHQTDLGGEIPDSVPMAPPIGYVKQPSMIENIRNMVRSEHLRQAAVSAGHETFEEADDFDVPDDDFPSSVYEMEEVFEPPVDVAPVAKPAPAPAAPASPPAGAPASADGSPAAPPSPHSAST